MIIAINCLFIIHVKAQEKQSDQHVINPIHPSVTVVLVVLSIMFCLTFLIVAYAKFCNRPEPYHQDEAQDPGGVVVRTRSRFSGIDRNIIESLPFFRFSSLKGSKEGLECAVCLSKFDDTEILRLLPKCRHAFHMNCIDKWLENHSSCPLCRYKFDVSDLKSLSYTNSFRNPRISGEESNFEFFIQREQSSERSLSSRFNNMANNLQKLARGKREEPLIIQEFREKNDTKFLHNFKHKIIVSDVIYKSRWSDVNSSDMMSLSSEMLNVLSEKRFSSSSGRFTNELSAKERILKIKEDIVMSKSLDPGQKRSMSEITNISRFTDLNSSNRMSGYSTSANNTEDDNVRRLWLPIARRTIQWFGGQETSSEAIKHAVNV
ncbi:hypothetical protein DH2020_025316 [Rehmannia glutinosa]|uniref:RING-type domain-containing protein n=1 Tax=Rehmannia glutinosa TaxID=99300 RepID=A0ABR0W003_REHGL